MDLNYILRVNKTPILIKWVFKYKFDIKEYFVKYKVRLCAKSDL